MLVSTNGGRISTLCSRTLQVIHLDFRNCQNNNMNLLVHILLLLIATSTLVAGQTGAHSWSVAHETSVYAHSAGTWDKRPWNLNPWWTRRELQMKSLRGPKVETASSICSTAKCQCQSIDDSVCIGLQSYQWFHQAFVWDSSKPWICKKEIIICPNTYLETWISICSSPVNDTQARKNHRYVVQIYPSFKVHWLWRFGSGKSFSMCSL